LNFDLNQSSSVINDTSINGIHFDFSNNNVYIASWSGKSIHIYHTNDETTFSKLPSISASYWLRSITTNNDKIYTGTSDGRILVYNKTSNALLKDMANMCSNNIYSVKYECNGNIIYSCEWNPVMVKITGTNGINFTLSLNGILTRAYDTYIDSKNRLWIGGNNGFVIYN
jgi:ligand-binding sensor domain-containing protein